MKTTGQNCTPYVHDFESLLSRYRIKRTNHTTTCNWKSPNKELLRESHSLASSSTTKKRLDLVYSLSNSLYLYSVYHYLVSRLGFIIDPQPICMIMTRKPICLTRINASISSLPAWLASEVSLNNFISTRESLQSIVWTLFASGLLQFLITKCRLC